MQDTDNSLVAMRKARWLFAIPVILVIMISAVYLSAGLLGADTGPVAPLDDAYITFQYARQIAQGKPYRYNDQDPPTTGMTSHLFGFLLAGAYRIGFTGARLVAFALGSGVIWLGLISWLTYHLALHLTERRAWALLGAVLALLTGSVQWGSFNGMETGFFSVLTLAALHASLVQNHELCALWLALAALTRTEGLILAGLIWALTLVDGLLNPHGNRWRRLAILSASLPIGLLPRLLNWLLTGDPSAAGLKAKSWFLNVPFHFEDIIGSVAHAYGRIILGSFLKGGRWFVAPGTLLLSLLGCLALGIKRRWFDLSVTFSWFAIGTLSTATLITATWHMGRYQVPFAPVSIALAVGGLAFLWQSVADDWKRLPAAALASYLVVASGYSGLYHLKQFRLSVLTMSEQQLRIARWLRDNLPPDARVGVHDTGSLRYVGHRPTYDVVGLTTPDAAVAWRHGAGSVFEEMEHSPIRPDYFAIYPDVLSIPYLAATDLFADELFMVTVPNYGVASAGPVQGVWRADWDLAGSGEPIHQSDMLSRTRGLELVDAVDVANLDDEETHFLEWWQETRRPGFPTEVRQLTYSVPPHQEILDGGRLVTGGLAFDAAAEPNRNLLIVARLHAEQAGAVRVKIDGQEVGRWAYPPAPGRWLETAFSVSGEYITGSQTRVRLDLETAGASSRHFSPYYLWLLQGDAPKPSWTMEHRFAATFGDGLSLVGFDLAGRAYRSGDSLPVTLYWRAQNDTRSDAKVFLHLYGDVENLVAQSDGWAVYGTRPPYTWNWSEVVRDPRRLHLPESLAPGEYTLEVGLYHPDGSGRLPAFRNGVPQAKNRVQLTTIELVE